MTRRRLVVRGTVQGVGFRPWAFRQATALGLAGFAGNDRTGLVIEVEGEPPRIDEMQRRLRDEPPPLARIDHLEHVAPSTGESGFTIRASETGSGPAVAVPADVATCAACLAEVRDPGSRRYRYPFTNCADCGPRYTIIRSLPYDRSATTMSSFPLCGDCGAEYADPGDRRFHAEPIACPVCGPTLHWEATPSVAIHGDAALRAATACLRDGGIVAVKGVGGYHLAVCAGDEAAVSRLRARKARDDKPFAVMVSDLEAADAIVQLDAGARDELTSPRRPIVVAGRRPTASAPIATGVAPGSPDLGVLLAYSPLHHLLLDDVGAALVMTSGNRVHEPMAQHPDDARRDLSHLADGFLHHDRPIDVRCDDSVVRAAGRRIQVVRRSRGYAPEPIPLPVAGQARVLAVGAELKNTVAVAAGGTVVASHHLGDLEHPAAYAAFEEAIARLVALTGVDPEVVAHDLHPEYLSTKWALDGDVPTIGVQHHHAHVASCLVDNGRAGPVLGLAFDGLGFGTDGELWGGEFLVADLHGFERLAHLRPVALPGGAAAVREPWRMALAWVALALGEDAAASLGPSLDPRWAAVLALTSRSLTPRTTSGGRLFDAIAALAGLRNAVTYEGQAAIELEAAARDFVDDAPAPRADGSWVDEGANGEGGPWILDPAALVADALAGRLAGTAPGVIAASFHQRLAAGLSVAAVRIARSERLATVALTGGVFQNPLLTTLVADALAAAGLEVLLHRRVPVNDGGISIGQAAIVSATS